MSHAADPFATAPMAAIEPETPGPLPGIMVVRVPDHFTVAADNLDRPYPVWGSLGGYRITCDGCGAPYEQAEPHVDDSLIETLRRSALDAGWSLHSGCHQRYPCLLCPACQEKRRQETPPAAASTEREEYERWLAMHVEALQPEDEGAYSSAVRRTPTQDLLRLRAEDAATAAAGYGQGVAA
jgi:hypothetical protein